MAALTTLLAEIGAGHTPWKIACRVVSTANITLSALQTIDAVALAEGDRVLVAGQTDPKQNGIYLASANTWTRAPDMAKSSYAMLGTTVRVMESGGDNEGWWTMSSPTNGQIRVGVTEMVFEILGGFVVPEPESETPPLLTSRFYTFNPDDVATLTLVGEAIQAATDAGGAPLSLTAPTSAKRPTRSNAPGDALNGRAIAKFSRSVASELYSASGSPTGDAAYTLITVIRIRDITTATSDFDPLVMLGDGGAGTGICRYGYAPDTNLLASGRGANQFPYSTAWGGEPDGRSEVRFTATEWLVLAQRYDPVTGRKELWISGEIHSSYAHANLALTAAFGLGSVAASTVNMDVAYAVFSSAVAPDSEMHAMHAWLAARFDLWLPARVTVLGDSLSQGQRPTPYGLLSGGWIGQAQLEGLLSTTSLSIDYKNTAISGYDTADYTVTTVGLPAGGTITRLGLAAWRYNAMRRAGPGYGGNVAVVWLASNGPITETGAAEWTRMQTILSTLRNAGFTVICATSIWRTDQNAEHVALDALIRAGSVSWDVLVDLDQVEEFESNTASYTENDGSGDATDGVHLRRGVADGQGIRTRSDGSGYGLIGYLFVDAIHEALT